MPGLSAATLKTYTSCLTRLSQEKLKEVLETEPERVLAWIKSTYESVHSQNTYISAILYHLRGLHADEPDPPHAAAQEALVPYLAEGARLKEIRNAKGKEQMLPAGKMTEMLEWPEVLGLDARAKEILTTSAYLIFLFYTRMPPLRADFGHLATYTRDSKDRLGNFLISSDDNKRWRLVLQEYKTSAKFGRQVFTLPEAIALQIRELQSPGNTTVLPGLSANALSKAVKTIFEKLTDKKMTINLLRHSYIKHFLTRKRTILEREALAKQMLHSTALQERYDIIHLQADLQEEED